MKSGIKNGLKIASLQLPEPLKDLVGSPPIPRNDSETALRDFNRVALRLPREFDIRLYFFFDELNLAKIARSSDEPDLRLALARDIVKASTEMKDYFAENDIDVHVICSLRPEVRDALIRADPELSKVIDSSYVGVRWGGKVSKDHLHMKIMRKVEDSLPEIGAAVMTALLPELVPGMLGDKTLPLHEFVLNLTWFPPVTSFACSSAINRPMGMGERSSRATCIGFLSNAPECRRMSA